MVIKREVRQEMRVKGPMARIHERVRMKKAKGIDIGSLSR